MISIKHSLFLFRVLLVVFCGLSRESGFCSKRGHQLRPVRVFTLSRRELKSTHKGFSDPEPWVGVGESVRFGATAFSSFLMK